jgi:LGFP repeat
MTGRSLLFAAISVGLCSAALTCVPLTGDGWPPPDDGPNALTDTGTSNDASAACKPYGLIGDKWEALGGGSSALGNCTANETDNGAGGRIERFQHGWINWTGYSSPYNDVAYASWGPVASAWMSRYGGPIASQPIADTAPFPYANSTSEESQFFDNTFDAYSYIIYNPGGYDFEGGALQACRNADNVCNIEGPIGQAWSKESHLAAGILPVSDSFMRYNDGGTVTGAEQVFDFGNITWNASNDVACAYRAGSPYWQVGLGACL